MKKSSALILAASVLALAVGSAHQNPPQPAPNTAASASDDNLHPHAGEPLLDHMVGNWVLRGTMAGGEATYDIDAEWVLNREYVRLHEVSRDLGAKGAPSYEAFVFISWDQRSSEYACVLLDSAGGGLSADSIGRAKPSEDTIPFLFKLANGHIFHTTLIYNGAAGTWQWVMDDEANGHLHPFARVTLTKRV
jgi:hypothetical protein